MYVCPQCAASVDLSRSQGARPACPYCGAHVPHETKNAWTDVARVTNLAEAGFLTDELVGLGVDARIYQLEEFSALTDRWATVYLIRVPAELARDAAARILEHLADVAADSEDQPTGSRFSADEQPIDPALWRPVALVVLAGVASFVLGQQFSERNDRQRPPRDSLATAIGAIGRPLLTEPSAGRPRHRLSFDRRQEAWYLDTDRNGDGSFDSRQQFQATGAAW